VLCNLLFCLFCIPFFTIGAALSAMHAAMQVLAEDADDDGRSAPEVFLKSFRANFKQATVLWLICVAGIVFLALDYFVVASMEGAAGKAYKVTFLILVLLFLFGFQYIFPIQARYRLKTTDLLRNAWLVSIAAFPWTVATLVAPVLLTYMTVVRNEKGFFLAIFLWMTVGFGIVSYLNSLIFLRVFRKKGLESMERTQVAGGREPEDDDSQ
jgi:uncharacterized membrane protein YesL